MHRLPVVLLALLVAVGPPQARLTLQPRTARCRAVRADLEADVALDLALGRGFGGSGGLALIANKSRLL